MPSIKNIAFGLSTLALAGTSLTGWTRPFVAPGVTHQVRTSGSSGTIYYHFDLPIKSTQQAADSLVLDGDNYTDLIMSSYVGGALLGRTLGELYPGLQFNKDYLYGNLWGQLLQENIETGLYQAGQELIDPSPLQKAVMGVGQGGPFQINNYDVDLVYGSYAPQGFAMLNYDAIQANIGFTFQQAPQQWKNPTPPSFNDKYFGPELAAFFHTNDIRALTQLGTTDYSPAPDFTPCLTQLTQLAKPPLDVIINYAYNQGFYGGLVDQATKDCANDPSGFVKQYDRLANAKGDSYHQYPYQVRFYLDEMYDKSTFKPPLVDHVIFDMSELGTVYTNVMASLAYVNGGGKYGLIPSQVAAAAYASALAGAGNPTTLDLSTAAQRAVIFRVLENALAKTEQRLGAPFSATTLVQL